ncbi:MAG: 50S ribosomal protein L11 methyltransferase [Armatimonadetes bacterium]|nr:50S ribosomal protein L11 methyltransferase [Armatimonadota bacterium]
MLSDTTGCPRFRLGEPLLSHLASRYRLAETCIPFGCGCLAILSTASMDELLDKATGADEIPFWAEVWASSKGLAAYLYDRGSLEGKTVLDLGAGVGVGGIAASLLGGRVVQIDYIEDALRFAALNALRNLPADALARDRICQVAGDWRAFPVHGRFDLIIGCDILYDPLTHPALEAILLPHLAQGGEVLIADPVRRSALDFMGRLEGRGFAVDFDTLHVDDRGKRVEVAVFRVAQK